MTKTHLTEVKVRLWSGIFSAFVFTFQGEVMKNGFGFSGSARSFGTMMLAVAMLAGCKSQKDEALEKAKQQAAATGQPQQVVSKDKDGTVTTTVVQPPAPGQTAQATSTTTARAAGVAPAANIPGGDQTNQSQPYTAGQPAAGPA